MSKIEIKVDNTHKSFEMEFVNNIKKRATAALAIGSAVLVMFSGCQSLATEKNEEIITELTTKVDTLINEDNTTASEVIYTTVPSEQTTTTKQVETTTKQVINAYDRLLQELNQVMENKSFNSEVKELILQTFNKIYENYNDWKEVYKELPTKEEYIKDKLINSLNYVNEINIYLAGTEEAGKVIDETGYDTFTTHDNKIYLALFNDETNTERFFHELIHVEQNQEENSSQDRQRYIYNGVDLSSVFREGEATFHQSFSGNFTTEKSQFALRENTKGDKLYYAKGTESGYADNLYVYNNLVYFVGYENLDKIKGENVFEQVEYYLRNKYGQEESKELLSAIASWEENRFTDKAYDTAVDLQNIFNKYIKQDINNLNTDKQIKQYIDQYNNYKRIVLPQVIDSNNIDITNEIFEISEIENLINNKKSQIQGDEER